MSVQTAWEQFAKSGSVKDYLRYREVKNAAAEGQEPLETGSYHVEGNNGAGSQRTAGR